jgi:hypothetical protein
VTGSLIAVCAFSLLFYSPGYLLAYAANLFGFRERAFGERSLWAIACSFAVSPILAYLIGRSAGLNAISWMFAATAVLALMLIFLRGKRQWSRRDRWVTALLACGWIAYVLFTLVDFQHGNKLFFSVVMADQSYRVAFTDAVVRSGVPPANPLYFAGSPAPMRYYYFWYVLCAAIVKFARVTSQQSFIASSVWAGFGLLAIVRLYTEHFYRWQRRQRWLAFGLLLVMGADLVPALGNSILQSALNGDIEWWSVDPIDAWPDSLLWVPHHVASVLCCLLAFLLLWMTREAASRRDQLWAIVLSALAFASAFGLSVYVAFGFTILVVAWLVRLAVLKQPEFRVDLRHVLLAGIAAAITLTPFLVELISHPPHAMQTDAGAVSPASNHIFSLSVRPLIDSGLVTGLPALAGLNKAHPILLDQGIRLLFLLPGLAMELGFYGAVLIFVWSIRRKGSCPASPARDTAFFFTVVGLAMTMFISSSVISNNDFGYRAVMLPQFFLTLLAADTLAAWWFPEAELVLMLTPSRRRWVYSLLTLGIAGFLYGTFLLRAWLPLEARKQDDGFGKSAQNALEIREAFAALHRVASPDAVVGFPLIDNAVGRKDAEVMSPNDYYQRMLVMNAGRQILNAEWKCATHFGGDPTPCREIQQETIKLYAAPAPSADWARNYCSRFGVHYLVLSHREAIWKSPTGWPADLPIAVGEPEFQILHCRSNDVATR